MTIGEQIFHVIQSMEKQDKRYFKLYASRYQQTKQKNTILLFDIINQLKEYSEEEVEKKATKKQIKNLPFVKNQLKKELLKALSDLWYNYSDALSEGDIINKLNIGYRLNIPEIREEWMNKARNHYLMYEDAAFQSLADVIEITHHHNNIGKNKDYLDTLYEQHQHHIDILQNELIYRKLRSDVYHWFLTNKHFLGKVDYEPIKILAASPYFQNESLAISYTSLRLLYFSKSIYYFCIKDSSNYLTYIEKIVQLGIAHKKRIKAFPNQFVVDYYNYIQACINQGKLAHLKNELELFRGLAEELILEASLYHRFQYYFTILTCTYNSKTDQTANTMAFMEDDVFYSLEGTHPKTYHHISTIYFCIIEAYFIADNTDKTLYWIQHFYDHHLSNKHLDQELTIRFYEVACHYNLGNFKLCENLLTRFKYFNKKYKLDPFSLPPFLPFFKFLLSNKWKQAKKKEIDKFIQLLTNSMGTDHYKTICKWGINTLEKNAK